MWVRLLIVIAIAAQAGVAGADEPLAAYERRGAAWQCPDRRVLAEALAGHLGDVADPLGYRVAVTMAGEGGELWAELRLLDGDRVAAERLIVAHSGDCNELIEAVALALAIALTPGAEPEPPPPPEPAESQATAAPTPRPPPVAPLPVAPPPPAAPHVHYAAGLGLAAGLGTSPGLSTGMTVEARARRLDLSIGLEYRHDLEASEPVAGGTFGMRLQAASLVPCLHRGKLAACAVASAGALRGQGRDLAGARDDATPFFAYGARLAIGQPVSAGLSVRLAAEVVGIGTGTTVRVGDMEVWSTAPAAASVGLTVLADIP